jgi:hypothetical protein
LSLSLRFPRGLALALTAAACSPAAAPAQADRASCSLEETSRTTLQLAPGREVFVEPREMVRLGSSTFIVGPPVFLWSRDTAGVPALRVDSLALGVVVGDDGAVSLVRTPQGAGAANGSIRVAVGHGGVRHVVYFTLADHPEGYRSDEILGAWYGTLGDGGWTHHEVIPLPALLGRDHLIEWTVSSLGAWGDTLALPGVIEQPEGGRHAVILWRTGGVWSAEILRTRTTFQASLGRDASGTFVLAHGHLGEPPDFNSLFLYRYDRGWQPVRRLAVGLHEPVYDARVLESGGRLWVSWWVEIPGPGARREARLIADPLDETAAVAVIDQAVVKLVPLRAPDGTPRWAMTRESSGRNGFELRLAAEALPGQRSVGAAIPYPFSFPTSFNAVFVAPDELLVTGADHDPEREMVTSLLIRLRASCSAPPAP